MAVIEPATTCSSDNHTSCYSGNQWGYFAVNNLITICIIGENSLTITLILRYRFLQTSTNLLALSLAVSDLLMGLIYPLYNVLNHTTFADHLMQQTPPLACSLCLYVILVSVGVSTITVLAISIDRYLAVIFPLRYPHLMKSRRIRIIILSSWIYMTIISASIFAVYGLGNDGIDRSPCSLLNILPKWYFFGLLLPHLLVPNIISKVLYIRIMYVASKQESKIFAERVLYNKGTISKREAKASKLMAKIVFLFAVCWSPYLILNVAMFILAYDTPDWMFHALELSKVLMLANSCMTPIIYFWKNRDFRRAMGRCTQCKDSSNKVLWQEATSMFAHASTYECSDGGGHINVISRTRQDKVQDDCAVTDV